MVLNEAIAKLLLIEPMLSSLENRLGSVSDVESLVSEATTIMKQTDLLMEFNTTLGSANRTTKQNIKVEMPNRTFYISEKEGKFKQEFSQILMRLTQVFRVLKDRSLAETGKVKGEVTKKALEAVDIGALGAIANIYKIKAETEFITIEQIRKVIECCRNANVAAVLILIVNSMKENKKQKMSFKTLSKRYIQTYCKELLGTEVNIESTIGEVYLNHVIRNSLGKY